MNFTLFQIDAFTDKLFCGNPAAVVPLQKWIDGKLMQKIAFENNLSETVFFVPCQTSAADADFEIRWFTPELEINLCGHATLASAFVLSTYLNFDKPEIRFSSQSGILPVKKNGNVFEMDFPSWNPEIMSNPPVNLNAALGGTDILSVYKNRDILVELPGEDAVRNCTPVFSLIKQTGHKIIITSKGDKVDFVSRFFAPTAGIDEDPVTGSAHSQLIPFWNKRLHKTKMTAQQLSRRGGSLFCEQKQGDRVMIGGSCVFYMKGEFEIGNDV